MPLSYATIRFAGSLKPVLEVFMSMEVRFAADKIRIKPTNLNDVWKFFSVLAII